MNTKTIYDALNGLVKYVLPALGTAYAGLAILWGFPHGEKVVGSVALLATLGGVILAWMKSSFTKELTIVAVPTDALPQNTAQGSVVDPEKVYTRGSDPDISYEPAVRNQMNTAEDDTASVEIPEARTDDDGDTPHTGPTYAPQHGA